MLKKPGLFLDGLQSKTLIRLNSMMILMRILQWGFYGASSTERKAIMFCLNGSAGIHFCMFATRSALITIALTIIIFNFVSYKSQEMQKKINKIRDDITLII